MENSKLRGVVAAAVTPVTAEFGIDSVRLASHCKTLLSDGCSFVSTFGTTGEGVSFSTSQKIEALRGLVCEGADMGRQVPAIMTPGIDEAGRMVAEVAALGCRAALVLPPYYYQDISDEGVVAFFDTLLEAAGRPDIEILLYNIPQLSRVSFTPDLVKKLIARFGDAIVGIKDSTGVLDNTLMLARTFPDLSVFTGDDRVMPPLVEAGGAGIIGGLPNLFSGDLRKLCDAPAGPEATQLSAVAAKRIEAVDNHGGLLALKAALAIRYEDPEWVRAAPPLMGLPPAQRVEIMAELERANFVTVPDA